jgi:ketosteroid isomerase-like protein
VEAQKDWQMSTGSEAEHELKAANEEWARALAHKDGAALDRIMADEFELAYPFEGDDKEQFISAVVSGDLRVESLNAHGATIRVSGDTGVVFGSETANWQYGKRDLSGNYRFLRVFTRQQGSWRILALHLCLPGQH